MALKMKPMDSAPSIFDYADLREFFRALFARSRKTNPRLSRSAFARYLGCSASSLSNFLDGRRELSAVKLSEIGRKLGWNQGEIEHALKLRLVEQLDESNSFTASVKKAAHSRANVSRRKLLKVDETAPANLDFLSVVLKQCVLIPEFAKNPMKAAEKLGCDPRTVERALSRMIEKGILAVGGDGKYVPTRASEVYVADPQTRHLNAYHRQTLEETARRLPSTATHRRYLGTETLTFDPALLPEAKQIINRCLDDLSALAYRGENPSAIFHAGVQFIEILEATA